MPPHTKWVVANCDAVDLRSWRLANIGRKSDVWERTRIAILVSRVRGTCAKTCSKTEIPQPSLIGRCERCHSSAEGNPFPIIADVVQ
jgi:hypothetical protein